MRVFAKKVFKEFNLKQGCAALRKVPHEVPAKVFKVFKTKFCEKSKVVTRKEMQGKRNELQWSFANCLRRSAIKIGRLDKACVFIANQSNIENCIIALPN